MHFTLNEPISELNYINLKDEIFKINFVRSNSYLFYMDRNLHKPDLGMSYLMLRYIMVIGSTYFLANFEHVSLAQLLSLTCNQPIF